MSSSVIKNIARFVFLIFIQVFILTIVPIPGNLQLFASLLFILFLPCQTSAWAVLVIAFATGLCVDTLIGSEGLHSTASVSAAFVRVLYFRITFRGGKSTEAIYSTPILKINPLYYYFYSGITILSYSIVFFGLDSFQQFDFYTVYLIVGSFLLTFFISSFCKWVMK